MERTMTASEMAHNDSAKTRDSLRAAEHSVRVPPSLSAAFAGFVLVVCLIETVWLVHRYAVNALYSDQWSDVDVVNRLRSGTLTFGTLWAQHNENRIFFPRLVVLILAETTHLNVVSESIISAALWWLSGLLLVLAHHRRSPNLSWAWYSPIALAFASTVALGDTLFGFNLSWFMALAALAASLYLLDRTEAGGWVFAAAIVIAVVGSFSTLQGLIIWPAGLVLLLQNRRAGAILAGWTGAAIVTFVVFVVGYRLPASGSTGPNGFGAALRFFFSSLGNVVGSGSFGPQTSNDGLLVLGVVVFAVAIAALVFSVRHPSHGGALGSALITFGLIFTVASTFGRSSLGLQAATRYSVFTLTIWCGSYLAVLQPDVLARFRWSRTSRDQLIDQEVPGDEPSHVPSRFGAKPMSDWLAPFALSLALALLVYQFAAGWGSGIDGAAGWHTAQLQRVNVAVNAADASDGVLVSVLGPDGNPYEPASSLRMYVAEAKRQRLSLFATSSAAEQARRGLLPYLGTQVLQPLPGTRLSGTAILDAAIGDLHDLRQVQFLATGEPGRAITIGTARATGYGWIYRWDTATVINGHYQIVAVASYATGKRTITAPVAVLVDNKS
jgi:hypothetical protein